MADLGATEWSTNQYAKYYIVLMLQYPIGARPKKIRDTENTDYDTVNNNIIGAQNILININLTNTQEITI